MTLHCWLLHSPSVEAVLPVFAGHSTQDQACSSSAQLECQMFRFRWLGKFITVLGWLKSWLSNPTCCNSEFDTIESTSSCWFKIAFNIEHPISNEGVIAKILRFRPSYSEFMSKFTLSSITRAEVDNCHFQFADILGLQKLCPMSYGGVSVSLSACRKRAWTVFSKFLVFQP